MSEPTISVMPVGMLDVNCYFVEIPASSTLYLVDPGSETDRVVAKANASDMQNRVILLTHGHVDHIGTIGDVADALAIDTIYLHEDDVPLFNSPDNHLLPYVPPAKNLPTPQTSIETTDFEIIHTPGHTRGGVCFLFHQFPALFAGDTLFRNSIGRTDLPGGDSALIVRTIQTKLFTLPEDLTVYPGHGPSTTIGDEKKHNPYVSG